ncbi:MAG: helix-turn-helix transcriptional regulator [Candidatus Dormibacteraeota bacterium]|uniref:Helix-turn-helix transcriptional regulator n=1 Tax=Candidatus Dormiibacter inghamiae TaxID=3127013 RepID=A0A934NCL2_9BACT|nr:helix-turn-helix transcriptional regulator [Candidatus Dormibacteraeota bacterium]MBJ7605437.1 helix-turn-helix transcriptional regulator [Candidatus Dormibacteraeota bacterium]
MTTDQPVELDWHARGAASRRRRTEDRAREAARSLFKSPGYSKTTMQMIADRAGVGVATLYKRFGSKSGIGATIFAEKMAPLVAIAAREANSTPIEKALSDHLLRLATRVSEDLALSEGVWATAAPGGSDLWTQAPDNSPRYLISLAAPLSILIRTGQKRGEISADIEPREAAEIITNLLLVTLRIQPGSVAETARSISRLVLRGLLVAPPSVQVTKVDDS